MARRTPLEGDADLEGMLDELDLSVARTAVSRRDVGGMDGGVLPVQQSNSSWESVHTPAGARRRSGTSDVHSEFGNAETVLSGNEDVFSRSFGNGYEDEIRRAVSVRSVSRSIKKHKFYKVPDL
jgi:hypothetical protein